MAKSLKFIYSEKAAKYMNFTMKQELKDHVASDHKEANEKIKSVKIQNSN